MDTIYALFLVVSLFNVDIAENNLLSKRASISFENADITVAVKTASGVRVAEAFNATVGAFRPQKMRWVSLGLPRLLVRRNNASVSNQSFFEFAPGGFYAYIETLSESVAVELAKEARVKYDNSIEPSQFLPIDKHIGSFSCFIDLYDSADDNEFARILGAAEIIANPIVVFFKLPNASKKHEKPLKDPKSQVIIQCNVESRARMRKQNVLTISSSTIEELNLKESIFGPSNTEVFVTRNQLVELARRMYKSLEIEEEYEIREEQFKTKFVEDLLSLVSDLEFKLIDIQTELDMLSHFAIDIKEVLKPDVIYKHLNNVFSVNTSDGKEHIILKNDQESMQSSATDTKSGLDIDTSNSWLGKLFGVKAQVNYYNTMKQDNNFNVILSDYRHASVDDQLRTLNTVQGSDVKWEREGNIIYPKSLNVTRVYRSKFERSLTFSRIFKHNEEAAFNERISLSTADYRVADIFLESYELARRSIMHEVTQFEDSLNNSVMQQLQQSDIKYHRLNASLITSLQHLEQSDIINLSNRISCLFAVFETSLANFLNNKEAFFDIPTTNSLNICSQFFNRSK